MPKHEHICDSCSHLLKRYDHPSGYEDWCCAHNFPTAIYLHPLKCLSHSNLIHRPPQANMGIWLPEWAEMVLKSIELMGKFSGSYGQYCGVKEICEQHDLQCVDLGHNCFRLEKKG